MFTFLRQQIVRCGKGQSLLNSYPDLLYVPRVALEYILFYVIIL